MGAIDVLVHSSSLVSMKSGLEGRNNQSGEESESGTARVSMKSGLEGRNNADRLSEIARELKSQ